MVFQLKPTDLSSGARTYAPNFSRTGFISYLKQQIQNNYL